MGSQRKFPSQIYFETTEECFKPQNFGKIKDIQLHHFSDASMTGYGQCSYLRLVNEHDDVHCSFVMGKARVCPLKPVTIPRLELMAALLSVRVSNLLREELEFEEVTEYFWTDSSVVLGYISNDSRRFHVFVANRVQQIRDVTKPSQWRHISTPENPADESSRGVTADDFISTSKWISGPKFLKERDLPTSTQTIVDPSPEDPEVRKSCVAAVTVDNPPQSFDMSRLEYFSSWYRLCKAIASCLRFKAMLKTRLKRSSQSTTTISPVEDLQNATQEIIKLVQNQTFQQEIKFLQSHGSSKDTDRLSEKRDKQVLKQSSPIHRLDPFLDENGILRVGGRLKRADIWRLV